MPTHKGKINKVTLTIKSKVKLIDIADEASYRFFKERDRENLNNFLSSVAERGEVRLA